MRQRLSKTILCYDGKMSIELKGVRKVYEKKHGPIVALEDINLTINNSTFVALVGASGSGKSTLLQIISGVQRPSTGQVTIDGKDIASFSTEGLVTYRRRCVGIIYQQFYLDPVLSVRQNIELPGLFAGVTAKKRAERTAELVSFMGLAGRLDHLPSEISGGQIQRVAIARAIYNQPMIIIADEPTSNLDPKNTAIVLELLMQIKRIYGTTIIVATHDPVLIGEADEVITVSEGRITS